MQVHDILQLAHVRRHSEYIPFTVRGLQLLGERFQYVDIEVSDGHFEPKAVSPACQHTSVGQKKNDKQGTEMTQCGEGARTQPHRVISHMYRAKRWCE